jgi:hypothetical protein
MKKLFVIFTAVALVWAFAAPASAVDWNFYGSARMATYWTSVDKSKAAGGDDQDLDWAWQNNSRIGARVKGENVSGRFELGLKADGGSDVEVGTRRLAAKWDFGAGSLSIEKGYTSFNQFISGQVGRRDNGLLGRGFMYAGRPGFIGLSFGGFGVQLIDIETSDFGLTGVDIDTYFPKVEANWGMAFDTFSFQLRGGYQTYSIDSVGVNDKNFDVTSFGLGAEGNFNFGPVRLGLGISYAENGSNARWTGSGAMLNAAKDDIKDTDTTQGGVVVGFKMSDMVSFEGGFGYRVDDFDGKTAGGASIDDTDTWEFYVQSVIGLAPGVYIIPEFGYANIDADGSNADSTDYYLGAKWQIDF